jgi:two-component system CheB/CheR fusion protein
MSKSSEAVQAPTRIVGLGASAGGLQPLEQFLGHVSVPSELAYIVVQHLDIYGYDESTILRI